MRDQRLSVRVGQGEKLERDDRFIYDADNQTGEVAIKVVVDDGGEVRLRGTLVIEKNIAGIEAFLSYKILVLGERAKVEVVPQLEIKSNEVKASHAASVSGVDEEQVFYLMSRGIGRKEAVELIVEAFLNG